MSTRNIILGVVAGAAAGAILGVLFAPRKGSKTRRKIANKGREIKEAVVGKVNDLVGMVSETFADAKDEANQRAEATRSRAREATNGDAVKAHRV